MLLKTACVKSVTKTTDYTPFLYWSTGDVHMSLVNPKHDSLSWGFNLINPQRKGVQSSVKVHISFWRTDVPSCKSENAFCVKT